jgi:hypothetical protein
MPFISDLGSVDQTWCMQRCGASLQLPSLRLWFKAESSLLHMQQGSGWDAHMVQH